MITEVNQSKTLTRYISSECKCKFEGRKYNLNQKWNNDKCWCGVKNMIYMKKIKSGILLHALVKMGNI